MSGVEALGRNPAGPTPSSIPRLPGGRLRGSNGATFQATLGGGLRTRREKKPPADKPGGVLWTKAPSALVGRYGLLQFISSILVGYAWPSVLIVLMVILRKQISALAARIEEVTLPGGVKAKFEKAIAEARAKAEKIEPAVRDSPTAGIQPQDSFLYLANNFPEAAIMEAFGEVERTLWEMVPFLGLPTNARTPEHVIKELQRKRYIDDNTAALFHKLREARNVAAHAGNVNRVGPGGALEFREQATTLNELLRRVLGDMQVNPPPEASPWVKEQARKRAKGEE